MADAIVAVGFPWVPAVVIVSAVAGGPGAVVFTVVDVPRVPAVAEVSAIHVIPTSVIVVSSTGLVFPMFFASLLIISSLLLHVAPYLTKSWLRALDTRFLGR